MDIQSRRQEFLEDTIKHFYTHKRAVIDKAHELDTYSYKLGCAIGRHLKPKLAEELDEGTVTGISKDRNFDKLPDQLKELGKDFLADVQDLHDFDSSWEKNIKGEGNKLTKDGCDEVIEICKKHNLLDNFIEKFDIV